MHRTRRLLIASLAAVPLLAGPLPAAHANWGVFPAVLPNPMHADEPHAEVLAKTQAGAVCTVKIAYTGTKQSSTVFRPVTIKSSAATVWHWHLHTKAKRAQAIVSCKYKGVTLKSIVYFKVLQH